MSFSIGRQRETLLHFYFMDTDYKGIFWSEQ